MEILLSLGHWLWLLVLLLVVVAFVLGILLGRDDALDSIAFELQENGFVYIHNSTYYITRVGP